MATTWYNRGLYLLGTGLDWPNAGLKLIVLGAGYVFSKDHDFVSDLGANEVSGGGYAGGFSGAGRKLLASPTVTLDDGGDRVVFDAADPIWVATDSGTWAQWAIWKPVTSDADSPLICHGDPLDLVTDGGDVTLIFNAAGILRLNNA